jgi:hypothetical protein
MERPEQLATARATELTTAMTSTEQPVGQTTRVEEPPTSKDVTNVANMKVPEQEPRQVPEQEAPEWVAPVFRVHWAKGKSVRPTKACPSRP